MIIQTKIAATMLLLAGAFFAKTAIAEGDAARGEEIGYSCLGCHGIEGYRNAYPSYRVPMLGGQKADYLVSALMGYKQGMRKHPTMQAQASSLTDQEIEDVAVYLAGLVDVTVEVGGAGGETLEVAATCVACHGQNGVGLAPTWPTLAGQHEDYIAHSLKQYKNGERKNAVMAPMAAALSDADIDRLARYYSELSGLETTLLE